MTTTDRLNLPSLPTGRMYVRKSPLWLRCQQVMQAMLALEAKGHPLPSARDIAAEIDPRFDARVWGTAMNVLLDKHLLEIGSPPQQTKYRRFKISMDRERFTAVLAALLGTGTHPTAHELMMASRALASVEVGEAGRNGDTTFDDAHPSSTPYATAALTASTATVPDPEPEAEPIPGGLFPGKRRHAQLLARLDALDAKLDRLIAMWE